MTPNFILIDGHFYKNDEKLFTLTRLENLLFVETIRSIRNKIMFWDDHLALVNHQLHLLNQDAPILLKDIKRQIERALVKNNYTRAPKSTFSFFCLKIEYPML